MEYQDSIPAAQYLRMSTEQQKYSLENQVAAISAYADRRKFEIVQTYSDAGRSGVRFRNRPGLRQLLRDVISGKAGFNAILVYDVSRWGRFQDCDEAAHYEFVCRQAGIPVHYCNELFEIDDGLTNFVMKAVKRAMAAEYSHELGNRVFAAERRWAQLGFKQGGAAGYALRRVMVSSQGRIKALLAKGEVKCLQSDRVMLVPGDPQEVECVREMYRLVVEEGRTPFDIARELNRRGITCRGRKWRHYAVYRILTHPRYAGFNVWNRSSRRLGGPNAKVVMSEWLLREGAFEPVVQPRVFREAQRVLADRTCSQSNQQILDRLKVLLAANGKITSTILQSTQGAPLVTVCKNRFGSLQRAFTLAGYLPTRSRGRELATFPAPVAW